QAFWSVVQIELSPEERRRLLLFITGTDRLPEAGCETLSIEVLFDIETSRLAATKSLGQVPTAHTCDNVLELPNYWMLLMRHEGRDEKTQLSDRLESRLREILAGRLRVALSNATGYALDDLDGESGEFMVS
ncbi:unnamed protein product, partial [Ectocarpus sp. 13 AM-2016]